MRPVTGFAETPLILTDTITKLPLGDYLEVLADPEGEWSLEDVRQAPLKAQFKPLQSKSPGLGQTDAIYWVRLTLQNPKPENSVWILQYTSVLIEELTLFRPSPDRSTYQQTLVGDVHPIANRDIRHPFFNFRIPTPAQQNTVLYLRLDSNGKWLPMSFFLLSETALSEDVMTAYVVWVIYITIFAVVMLYTLLFFIILRDVNYLYYSAVALFTIIAALCQYGLDDLVLWSVPGKKGHYAFVLSLAGSIFFQLLFTRSFLNLSQYLRFWDWVVKSILIILALWVGGLWWVPEGLQSLISITFYGPLTLLILLVSILRYRQQFEPALFLIIGALSMIIAVVSANLGFLGGFVDPFFDDISIPLGRVIECTVLMIGLARAYRLVLQEKLNAQAEIIQLENQMVEQLRRADTLKDEFLANTSHELKTPLHGIIGLCKNMMREPDTRLTQEHITNLQLMTSSAQRLASLVGDILDFSKIKNQDLQLQRKPIELQSTVRLAEQLCVPLVGSKSIRFFMHLPDEPIWVQADENRLQQILINLISNAIKFTHDGSIEIRVDRTEQQATIAVKDSGIGIDAEQKETIFKPFSQADGSISKEYGGTGLGLAITLQLVKLHQGDLQVESALNEGSTFTVTLPLTQEANFFPIPSEVPPQGLFVPPVENSLASETPSSSEEVHNDSPATILVVDDEPLNVKVLEDYLAKMGFAVITASDGLQALECFKTQSPSLILLDVMMPRLNGYEVCRQIRETHNGAQLPIIMQTAKHEMDSLLQGLQVGANDYITKPFHYEELFVRIQNLLQQKEAVAIAQENQKLQWEINRANQIEASLRLSQKRLSQLLDVGKEALLAVNENGTIIYCNQVLTNWLHYASQDLQGKPVSKLIPPKHTSHPLQFQWSEGNQSTSSLHYHYVMLKDGRGGQWEGQIWQTLMELEEPFYVLTLAPLSSGLPLADPPTTLNWLETLTHNRFRLQQVVDILTDLQPEKLKAQPLILKELNAIDKALAKLVAFKSPNNPEERFKQTLVEVMLQAIDCWETATQSTAIELAETSGLWKVYMEDNRMRARVLERYLEPKRLPNKPRWRTVVRTANFVLSHCSLSFEQKSRLEAPLNRLLQLAHQRNLSFSGD